MTEFATFTGKNVDEAVNNALLQLQITSEKLEYEVVEKGSNGLLGFIGSKPAVIRARKKSDFIDEGEEFLQNIFHEMNMEVDIAVAYNKEEQVVDIVLTGEDMGILIGKRGQTLDSLQHLVSLVINKHSEEYIRVKLDTENYRERRKETLEQLAKNIAYKVKRTRRPASLEPMNPYERRVIHSALQADRYVETHSEGEEPFRKVVVTLKDGVKVRDNHNNNRRRYGNSRGGSRNSHFEKRTGGRE